MDVTFRWSTLLKKYMDNTITPEELLELERQRLSSAVKQRQFEDLTDPKKFVCRVQQRQSNSKQIAWEKIMAGSDEKKGRLVTLKSSLKWIFGSAAIIAACVIGINVLSSHREPEVKSYPYVNLEGDEYRIDEEILREKRLATKISYKDSSVVIYGNATLSNFNSGKETFIVTSKGSQLRIVLSDGTKVVLNAASSIVFPLRFTGKERKVTVYGQALFDVKYNEKPFVVVANDIKVKAIGTTFNITNYKNEDIKASLVRGQIELMVGKKRYMLQEGQEAVLDNDHKLDSIHLIDKEQAIAWTKNEFDFRNATIQEIMNELSRWYNVDVEYKGEFSNKGYYVRFFRSDKLVDILNVINAQKGITATQQDNRLVVVSDIKMK